MRRALLAALLVVTAACAPNRGAAYEKSIAEARRAASAGRFDVAAERYAAASNEAKVPRDAVYARYSSALSSRRAGDVARASRELRAIAEASPPNAYSAEASFKLAELASDPAEAYRQYEHVAVTFPESGVAEVAIVRIARHDDEGGADNALAHLDAILPRVAGKHVEQTVAYERAKRLAELGRTEAARDAFVAIADKWPYPFGSYFDDSLYRASELDEKLGKLPDAIEDLERLLRTRETSSFMGSYERPKYVPAILRIAALYETKLNDRPRAREALHRLYADFTTSPLRDDALWREADLWRQDGDQATACKRLSTLTKEFPHSRYVPCAALRCPGIERPAQSKAPKTCRTYIERGEAPTQPTPPKQEPND